MPADPRQSTFFDSNGLLFRGHCLTLDRLVVEMDLEKTEADRGRG